MLNLSGFDLTSILGSNFMFEQFANSVSYIGKILIDDDAHDFGWFSYQNRNGHPDHPSPFHHWQYGMVLVVIGEVCKYIVNLLDVFGIQINEFTEKIRNFLGINNKVQMNAPIIQKKRISTPINVRFQNLTSLR